MKTEEAILYSYDVATVPSIIPAFANAKDVIVVDDGCCGTMRSGCHLSRAKVVMFKHNDMKDLEEKLRKIVEDGRHSRKPLNRRFVVVEGAYQTTGDIAPIKEIVSLKNKYKFRLLVDESMSLGVLGQSGRGAAEHAGVAPEDIDIVSASLGNAIASIGGFCAGAREIVDHQRLSGLGYCFSASLPPYLASTSVAALDILNEQGPKLISKVQENAVAFRKSICKTKLFEVEGGQNSVCPLIHVKLSPVNKDPSTWHDEELNLQRLVNYCLKNEKVLFTVAKYSKLDHSYRPSPSIKVAVSAAHEKSDIDKAVEVLVRAHNKIFK